MSEPAQAINLDLVSAFCSINSTNLANQLHMEYDHVEEKDIGASFHVLAEAIANELLQHVPTLKDAYPHIAKYLYADDNASKSTHKQMFWRIFGDIALANLQTNLSDCTECPDCGIKIPSWSAGHNCKAIGKKTLACIDCGSIVDRTGPKQCRCESCQSKYRTLYFNKRNQARPTKKGR